MSQSKNFALIGASGYIAPRHLKAIKETGNNLVAALDPFDSVGVMDCYFPESDFFIETERFDRYMDKLRRKNAGNQIDYVSICSPNYLHDSHIRIALRNQTNAICEKPTVLNPWNIDAIKNIESGSGKDVFTILQLRLHPSIVELKSIINDNPNKTKHDIDLTYITSRGHWYDISWKGNVEKSGGVATNIGIHFFDMLSYIFGDVKDNIVHLSEKHRAAGFLELENARVRWFTSIDSNDLPKETQQNGQRTYRSITVDGREIEFSGGFTDLHTASYENILNGDGFGLEEARQSINTAFHIRNSKPIGPKGDYHPMAKGGF